MIIATCTISMRASWVHSLKEKRMIVKSLCSKVRNKFNVSIAEIDMQDIHQSIVIGIAAIAGDSAHADSIIDNVINFIESITDAEIISVERELICFSCVFFCL